ncbi:MAG: bis(5'-nucleosyl)-tetraphosphatase (symmetrical) YqeK [Elusimicrobia bacterium]|nr:bis(5'-nucleosyl)-tetraphosphatase (symmetrical) YqeK [Elusimicrobiota bacterium]
METILFGGTFDPPHAGHLALLAAALRRHPKARAVVSPAWRSPLKGLPAASAADRLAMTTAALRSLPAASRLRTTLDPWESQRDTLTYSWEALRRLKTALPGAELLFLAGADSWETLPRWKRVPELARLCRFLVGRRPGAPAPKAVAGLPPLELLPGTFPDLSSTGLRARLLCGAEPRELLPAVRRLIARRGLYGGTLRAKLARALSPERCGHTLAVAEMARGLALRHGLDAERAALAGLLHDCGRAIPVPALAAFAKARRLDVPARAATAARAPLLFHAYASEELARTEYGVSDPAVLSAVRKHTLGDVAMSPLDRLLYTADACSADRTYPGVADIRRAARRGLDAGFLEALRVKHACVLREGGWLHPTASAVWNAALEDA